MRHVNRRLELVPATGAWQRWALNIGAVLGSLCLVFAAVTLVFGLKPLIFSSGSMGPAIPTGSLALAVTMPVADALPGQVVSVLASDGTRITHRVVSSDPGGGLVLKGDANPTADLQPYAVESVDRVVASVPWLGFAVSWFSQPWLFFLAGLVCAYLVYIAFARRPVVDPEAGLATARAQTGRRAARGAGVVLTMVALVAGLGLNARVASTQASFTGTAVANAGMTTLMAVQPSGVTCTDNAGNAQTIRFDWASGSPAPTGYIVTGKLNGSAAAPTVVPLAAGTTSYSTSISSESGLLGSLLNLLLGFDDRFTVTISAAYGSWQSAPVSFTTVHGTAGLLGSNKRLTCT